MDTDVIVLIAKTSMSLLLPYLKQVSQEAAQSTVKEIGKQIGNSLWDKSKQLFQTIHTKFNQKPPKPESGDSLTALCKEPDNANLQDVVRRQLEEYMKEDDEFAASLAEIISDAADLGADVFFQTTLYGDVKKFVQIGNVYGDVSI